MTAAASGSSRIVAATMTWRRMGWGLRIRKDSPILAQKRIGGPAFGEASCPQQATIAVSARPARRAGVVTAVGEAVVEAERQPAPDDVGFREGDERRAHADPCALDAGARGERRQRFERPDELGTAVGITGIIERVDAD